MKIHLILNKLDRSYVTDLLLAFNLIKNEVMLLKNCDTILLNYITSDIIVGYKNKNLNIFYKFVSI